ncbi:hypothetical protein EJ07DRAFT_150277 [Lizonia empirigonia]|nr:hypothetical protein EJ07DRAFT_150277 [Lizonia empirigonia]
MLQPANDQTPGSTPQTTSQPANPTTQKHPRAKANPKPTSTVPIRNPPKRPRLPRNTTISKRPLLHPALPSPFASATSPKTLYITATSPFTPTCKRVRALLVQMQKRVAQSASDLRGGRKNGLGSGRGAGKILLATGRLAARDVEASIAARAREGGKSGGRGGEEVYLKATGRAIPRALELGVRFQGEEDCRVRVEMGSVKAIDDVEVKEGGEEGVNAQEEEVPETRIRTLSTVTVCIGLK